MAPVSKPSRPLISSTSSWHYISADGGREFTAGAVEGIQSVGIASLV
jgi:hypothetical protein